MTLEAFKVAAPEEREDLRRKLGAELALLEVGQTVSAARYLNTVSSALLELLDKDGRRPHAIGGTDADLLVVIRSSLQQVEQRAGSLIEAFSAALPHVPDERRQEWLEFAWKIKALVFEARRLLSPVA